MVLDRDCMSDRICRTLAERIIGGLLAPGERLVEMRIAKEFRTSQAPVREALRELEALRLVASEPYRGTRCARGWREGDGRGLRRPRGCWSRPRPRRRLPS